MEAEEVPPAPVAKKDPVTDTYHDVSVTDDYRWLENWEDSEVKRWSEEQNAHARGVLDGLPGIEALREEVGDILGATTTSHFSLSERGGNTFAMRRQPPKPQPFLVLLASLDDPQSARVVVDPQKLDPDGLTHIDWYRPSPDGKLVAVSLSVAGSETGDVHVFDVATGERVHEVVPRVNGGTAGGAVAWSPDGKGYWYTRYPRSGERPDGELDKYVQVYWHALGTDTKEDVYELGKEFPDIAEIDLDTDLASGRVLATVQHGDSGRFAHWIRDPKAPAKKRWKKFSNFGDGLVQASFGAKDVLYAVSRKGAPRGKLLRLDARKPSQKKAKVLIPEQGDTLVSTFWGEPTVRVIGDTIYAIYQLGGPSEIRAFDQTGKAVKAPTQLPVSSVGGLAPRGDKLLYANGSYVEPYGWYEFDPANGEGKRTGLYEQSPVDFDDVEVRREMATSKDGTKVPVNILIPKGAKLDGSSPCIVTGYGGYGISLGPSFSAVRKVLLRRGVIWVQANLRGGSEFGEQWHRQGALTHKQNVFDDFAAALNYVLEAGYTSKDRLGIIGGSNGGLLMGATMVQNEDLMAAVVSKVGIYDMLRVELSPNGTFNIPEFGTVKDKGQFEALHAYSPYHHVRDGAAYPPILFTTGENDPRVDPMQSRKMTARVQAAMGGKGTVLLRTNAEGGHGGGAPLAERISETAHTYAFFFAHLAGVEQ
jgi:prolyl oligopeptidase